MYKSEHLTIFLLLPLLILLKFSPYENLNAALYSSFTIYLQDDLTQYKLAHLIFLIAWSYQAVPEIL